MTEGAKVPAPARQTGLSQQFLEPFHRLRDEVDRMFDEFPTRWPSLHFAPRLASGLPAPAIEMTETRKAYKVAVEVPGIEPGAIEVEVDRDMLVVKGEKSEQREEEEKDYTLSERSYGAFERRISIPADAVVDDIKANTTNGVLKITIPRDGKAGSEPRKIEIKSAKAE